MQMSKRDIIGKFNRSDDKKGYLKILAQLNGCSEDDIKKVLVDGGVDVDAVLEPKTKKASKGTGRAKVEAVEKEQAATPEATTELPLYKSVGELMESPELTENEQERLERALKIPMAVRQACVERMEVLRAKIMELEKERDEICDFLNGEVANG